MEGIYEWVRNLVFYLILMTMVLNLLPDRKYEKYLRLFTGMVFILLVFWPFTRLGGMEERLFGAFEKITFQNDAKLLKNELLEADEERMRRLADGYARAVEEDLKNMAQGTGVTCTAVLAVIEDDLDSGEFGGLRSVDMRVFAPEAESREGRTELRQKANREIGLLKKRIGEYYGLEEGNIQIQLEDE